ncbi:MAG TPA: agmatine deiminase family protein [Gammaproteobacteria bacterium]|nr:agmatine deiminase family protein [Gammaproteobacteria bacterium]
MPPEWAPHAATWLSWPHNRDTWPVSFEGVEPAMTEVVAALAPTELVYINVQDEAHERHVSALLRKRGVPAESVRFFRIPTNDAWVRDHGPIFVLDEGKEPALLAVDFEYNAWGGKYPPYDLDRRAGERMAEALGVPRFAPGIVLEGGSIDVNGAGALLTTEQCLLNPNRNPDLTRAEIERILENAFGVRQVVWLGEGIEGDDTDGHVDDLTRFVSADTVVTVVEPNRADRNHAPLAANVERLAGVEIDGKPLRVVELPMPEPQFHGAERLPASYANFYVANGVVLLPTFACAQDARAAELLAACFRGRRVVPIDCRALVGGLGALHCLTQQVPAAQDAQDT